MFGLCNPKKVNMSFKVDTVDYTNRFWVHLKRNSPTTDIPVRADQYKKIKWARNGDVIDVTVKPHDWKSNPGFYTYPTGIMGVEFDGENKLYRVKTSSPIAELPMNIDDYNRLGRPRTGEHLTLIVKKHGHIEHLKRSAIGLVKNTKKFFQECLYD
jgi:hypothetical protein